MSKKVNSIDPKIIDELIKTYEKPEDLLGENGILKQLQKAMLERILEGEITTELGYKKHDPQGNNSGNSRNGYSEKTLKSTHGELPIQVPRDRNGDFSPQIIPKHQTRFDGFDKKIISLYSRGMTVRDIQEQLQDLYGVEVSATLISNVTNEVIDEVKTWQSRPLDKIYPIVYLDALVIKINEDKRVINKAFYLVVGVNLEGQKELLGIWISQEDIRKAIYTTNAIESINMSLRKVIKNKRVFPSDDAALKQLFLALKNISKKWTMPIHNWKDAMNCFIIIFEERLSGVI